MNGSGDAHLEIRELVVQRGGVTVLEIDSLDIPRGLVTVMIGPNGSGKSTLLGALQLVLHPSSGSLMLDGEPMDADPVGTRRRMAAAFQEPLLLSMSVQSNVELPLRLAGRGPAAAARVGRALAGAVRDRLAGQAARPTALGR